MKLQLQPVPNSFGKDRSGLECAIRIAMREKRGGFFRRGKDSMGNILSEYQGLPISPLIYENAPGAARTRNLQLRRLTLYPVELRALVRDGIIICPSADHNPARTPTRIQRVLVATALCRRGSASPRLSEAGYTGTCVRPVSAEIERPLR